MYNIREKLLGEAKYYALIALIVFVVGVLIGASAPIKTLDVKFAGTSVKIDFRSRTIDHRELLEKIFSEDISKTELMDWLSSKKIYSFDDPRLAQALKNDLCDPITGKSIKEKVKGDEKCASMPLAKKLRELVEQKEVPFHYVGTFIQVGVPVKKDQPKSKRTNVCRNSKFRAKKLELINPRTGARVEVRATGLYTCTGYSNFPDIQLNYKDAKKLFKKPLAKYQEVVAVTIGS